MNLPAAHRPNRSSDLVEEVVSREKALKCIRDVISENGFFVLTLSDGLSNVDFGDAGDNQRYFIEQYYDLIYGGLYSPQVAERIINLIFEGCTSDQLRDLFPKLEGELIYEYKESA